MARIRTVKPEFWTAEQIMELSPMARLLFIGMWNFCDDRGVHPVAYKTLKAEVFPADDLLSSDVERMIGELIFQGLLSEFEANGRRWWFVTGWHHQVINRPSKSRYPEPPRTAPLPSAAGQGEEDRDDAADQDHITEGSRSDHGALPDGREGSRKGREGIKGEPPERVVPSSTAVAQSSDDQHALDPDVTPNRAGLICKRLRESGMDDAAVGYLPADTWAQILALRTDDEIVEIALAKKASRPGQRTGLKYVAPALLEPPAQIVAPPARASPGKSSPVARADQLREHNRASFAAAKAAIMAREEQHAAE